MVQVIKGMSFGCTEMELIPLIGRRTSLPWPQVKELRRSPLGFTSIRSVDGRRFIAFIGPQETETLIGILREASDARIIGFKAIE